MTTLRSCAVCHIKADDLVRYGFRNYAHGGYGLKKWGIPFLNRLSIEQLESIPVAALLENGLFSFHEDLLKRKRAVQPSPRPTINVFGHQAERRSR